MIRTNRSVQSLFSRNWQIYVELLDFEVLFWNFIRNEVAREIDNMKHWTDGGLKVAREIGNMKHWTNGGLEVAREIDNMKHWTEG